jgi:hypothetical protein
MEQTTSPNYSAITHDERILHADAAYQEGNQICIIPHEKLARIAEPMPTEDHHRLDFFRRHAEYVQIWEPSTMACKAPVDRVQARK